MNALKGGNPDALDGVYRLMSKNVYLLAYAILRDGESAKDVLQETFIRVAANIHRYMLDTNASAWIGKIARNLSYRKLENSRRTVSAEDVTETLSDGIDLEERVTNRLALTAALKILTVAEREIVLLFAVEGYKHREIAEIVGKPMGTVQWIYHKAIKKLGKQLQ
jgi:RNA polymerase sigma-70 factor (ECF subfamily)